MKFKTGLLLCIFGIVSLGSCENTINSTALSYNTSPSNIVLQYTYRPEPGNYVSDFSVTPAFTLYGDGRLIFSEPLFYPCMPSWYGYRVIYQPDFSMLEVYLSKSEIAEILNYVKDKGFFTFNRKYVNPNSNKAELEVLLNLKRTRKRVTSVGFAKPQEFLDICMYLRNYFRYDAKPYQPSEISVGCELYKHFAGYEPVWTFSAVNLEKICNSVKGQKVGGQDMQDILNSLTYVSRVYQYNGKYYVLYYKPLLPY